MGHVRPALALPRLAHSRATLLHTNALRKSDFADEHASAEVIGTDLSPMQPAWVPANLRFEIDDATLSWTWPENTFDFVHIRYLFGAIQDWSKLFKEAYRCTKPGGWTESCEAQVDFLSDDGTADLDPVLKTWNTVFREGGRKTGRSFIVHDDDSQRIGMEAAGFTDIRVVNYKVCGIPFSPPQDAPGAERSGTCPFLTKIASK